MKQAELKQVWIERIKDYRSSGERVSTWCERHDVTNRQLWYWMRKLKRLNEQAVTRKPQFVPIHVEETLMSRTVSLHVTVGSATIEVNPGFEPALLADVVKALQTTC